MIIVPHTHLRPETLLALIEEFITRDGAVQGHRDVPLELQVEAVRRQLAAGTVQIAFCETTETWTILPADTKEGRRSVEECQGGPE